MTISKRPTIKTAEDFISGATEAHAPEPATHAPEPATHAQERKPAAAMLTRMPWDDLNPRIIKGINLRLPETTWAKLNFLKYHTNKSIQSIIMDALLPEIDRQIKELTGEDPR